LKKGTIFVNGVNIVLPVLLILVWLMPVSNQSAILNSVLINRMYLYMIALFSIMIIYDFAFSKIINTIDATIIIVNILIVLFFSYVQSRYYPSAGFGYREFSIYLMMLFILGYHFRTLTAGKIWRVLFYAVSILIAIVGVLMIIGNSTVWKFLGTYYVNHYSYSYVEFEALKRPITFFAANSTTTPEYFLIYCIWEFCETEKHPLVSAVFKIIYIFLMAALMNNSGILAIALIALYYLVNTGKQLSIRNILLKLLIFFGIVIALIYTHEYIQSILFSGKNGVLGRYSSSGAGNVLSDIKYITALNWPTGFTFVPNLYFSDSGVVVNLLRAGVIGAVGVYLLLWRAFKYALNNYFRTFFMFMSLMFFEVAYPILVEQRFLLFLCFFLIYVKRYAVDPGQSNVVIHD